MNAKVKQLDAYSTYLWASNILEALSWPFVQTYWGLQVTRAEYCCSAGMDLEVHFISILGGSETILCPVVFLKKLQTANSKRHWSAFEAMKILMHEGPLHSIIGSEGRYQPIIITSALKYTVR